MALDMTVEDYLSYIPLMSEVLPLVGSTIPSEEDSELFRSGIS